MNILLINYEYPPLGGGGGVAMKDIAWELAHRHRVHVLTSAAPGLPLVESASDRDLTIFRTRVLHRNATAVASIPSMLTFYPAGIQLGKRLIKMNSYDVVNTWFAIPSGPTGVYLASKFKLPHLLTIIGGDVYDPSKWYSPHRNFMLGQVVKRVLRKADRHTSISNDVACRTKEIYEFHRPIEVIPLGVKTPQFPAASRKDLGLAEDKFYIITVGRLVRRKDHQTLLHALSMLKHKDANLLVVGDGPESQNLQDLANTLKISGQVQFRGFVSEDLKYQLLSNSDVFALTSLHEGFGLVFLEAMHCGLPVIAARTGGQNDFLQDGKTGFLVPHGDQHALKKALSDLIEQKELCASMADKNRRISCEFSVSNAACKYEELLEETRNAYKYASLSHR
jgi:glycosyltransferase involved in cell wall biosynthesis